MCPIISGLTRRERHTFESAGSRHFSIYSREGLTPRREARVGCVPQLSFATLNLNQLRMSLTRRRLCNDISWRKRGLGPFSAQTHDEQDQARAETHSRRKELRDVDGAKHLKLGPAGHRRDSDQTDEKDHSWSQNPFPRRHVSS